jgi:hypothetical protein
MRCERRMDLGDAVASPENIRAEMAPLLPLIRFPTMARDEFFRVVGRRLFLFYIIIFFVLILWLI